MSVIVDSSGVRSVQVEVEVPGTPDEVWRAVATGPGISSWFVPTQVEERVGGAATSCFGPGMDSTSTVTVWNPPHLFSADSRDDMGTGDPTVTTDWIVEPRAGGTCLVRIVHRWKTDSDKWDAQFEQHEYGWTGFFRLLRLYLTHFRGQRCAAFQVMAFAPGSQGEAWRRLVGPLGLDQAISGQRIQSRAGTPPVGGIVERVGVAEWPEELLLRTDTPAPGIAHFFAMPMGGQACLSIRFFLYGQEAPEAAANAESAWQAWVQAHFPPPAPPAGG